MEIYLFEVRNLGKNPHFQAVFESVELVTQAMSKYLNDPAFDSKLMIIDTTPFTIQTDLSLLDIVLKTSNKDLTVREMQKESNNK